VPLVKQILHLDDYDVEFGEEEDEVQANAADSSTMAPTTTMPSIPPTTTSTTKYTPTAQVDSHRQDIEEVLDNIDAEEETNDDEEEEGEDLFFWKPDYDPRRQSATVPTPNTRQEPDDPFQIVSHPSQ